MTITPAFINKENEVEYEALANQVFAEVRKRFKNRIRAFRPEYAPVLRRGGDRIADHVWNIVWPSGPNLWGQPYRTDVPGVYLYPYNAETALIHMISTYSDIDQERKYKQEHISRYEAEKARNPNLHEYQGD